LRGTHAHNRTGDGVCSAHRDSQFFAYEEGYGAGCFRTDTFEWCHFGNPGSHGLYNFPTTAQRSECNTGKTGQWNPSILIHKLSKIYVVPVQMTIIYHCCAYDAHYLLCVVASMSQTEQSRGYQLQPAEPFVSLIRI